MNTCLYGEPDCSRPRPMIRTVSISQSHTPLSSKGHQPSNTSLRWQTRLGGGCRISAAKRPSTRSRDSGEGGQRVRLPGSKRFADKARSEERHSVLIRRATPWAVVVSLTAFTSGNLCNISRSNLDLRVRILVGVDLQSSFRLAALADIGVLGSPSSSRGIAGRLARLADVAVNANAPSKNARSIVTVADQRVRRVEVVVNQVYPNVREWR